MRFALTDDQHDMQVVVRTLLAGACRPDVIRAAEVDATCDEVVGLRARFTELGVWGLLVAEEAGGLGLDESFVAPLLTETGRAGTPLPVVDSIAFAPGLLAEVGRSTGLAEGAVLCAADLQGRGVAATAVADLLLVGGWGGTGPVRVVDLSGVDRSDVRTVDPVAGLQRIRGGREIDVIVDPDVVRQAWLRGVLGAAAELIGVSRRMLDMTVAYVAERRQFGVPIGSFQAIQHHLADVALAVEFANPTVASAGALLAAGDQFAAAEVSSAKALASDAAALTSRLAIQCHGAMGYTTEYDLHFFVKRAWALSASWGSAAWHRDALAASLGLQRSGNPPIS